MSAYFSKYIKMKQQKISSKLFQLTKITVKKLNGEESLSIKGGHNTHHQVRTGYGSKACKM